MYTLHDGNADEFDVNLIVVPGILHQHHPYVTNLVVDMCENRGDCFYVMDLYSDDGNPTAGQIDEVLTYANEFDTNYAAAYYPWIKILDTNNNKIITVPPSVFSANDIINVQQIGAGQVSFAQGSGVTITSTGATSTAPKLRAQYSAASVICTASNTFTVIGDIS
jgi:hypothetical protein